MTYDLMRHFADSWGLVGMFAFFLAASVFAFRPGSGRAYEDAAQIPFKDENKD